MSAARGLMPVVVQDQKTLQVLMLAYANAEAVALTRSTGFAHFWSRSRDSIWKKGESSGNFLAVAAVIADCDGDALLYLVDATGPACHTGEKSCFFKPLGPGDTRAPSSSSILHALAQVIEERKTHLPPGSYVTGLFARGEDAILEKMGEEATEVVLAAKARDREGLCREMADLWFHCLVALAASGLGPDHVLEELERRRVQGARPSIPKPAPGGENAKTGV